MNHKDHKGHEENYSVTPSVLMFAARSETTGFFPGIPGQIDQPNRACVDDVSVADRTSGVCDVFAGGYNVLGVGGASEFEAAADVIVVDVRLQNVRDAHTTVLGGLE